MNAGEPVVDETTESTESTTSDLRKAPVVNAAAAAPSLSDDQGEASKVAMPKAVLAPRLVGPDPVISGGQDDDGPRPHPWSPAPETKNDNTNSGSNGSASQ